MNRKYDAGYVGGAHITAYAHSLTLLVILLVPKTSCENGMYRGRIEPTEMCLPFAQPSIRTLQMFYFYYSFFDYYSQLLNGLDAIEVKAFMFFVRAARRERDFSHFARASFAAFGAYRYMFVCSFLSISLRRGKWK